MDDIPYKYRGIFVDIISLMAHSSIHRNWSLKGIIRLTIPPLMLNQCRVFKKNGKAIAYISWANLTKKAADGYINDTRKLQPQDWNAGTELWVIDFIAPYGDVSKIVRKAKQISKRPLKSKRLKDGTICGINGKILRKL